MKLDFICRNCQLNDHLKEVTTKKLSKLDKYFLDSDVSVKVYFKKEKDLSVSEVMLDYFGKFVRATEKGDNFYDTLDGLLPKLEGQIRKHRTRFDKDRKNSAYKMKADFDLEGKFEKETSKVVKEKAFVLTPMTIDEAITEMELLGHSFYLYKDVKTENICLIYKRNDGDLGLIEPK